MAVEVTSSKNLHKHAVPVIIFVLGLLITAVIAVSNNAPAGSLRFGLSQSAAPQTGLPPAGLTSIGDAGQAADYNLKFQ